MRRPAGRTRPHFEMPVEQWLAQRRAIALGKLAGADASIQQLYARETLPVRIHISPTQSEPEGIQ